MDDDTLAKQTTENQRLSVFVGKWHTLGDMYDDDGKVTGKIDAIDTYEWAPGKSTLIHYADSTMGEDKIHGVEMIGYDSAREAFFGPFFDDHGGAGWEEIRLDGDTWIWHGQNVMGVKYHRCEAVFKDENTVVARHEHSEDDESWKPWMDITLTRMF